LFHKDLKILENGGFPRDLVLMGPLGEQNVDASILMYNITLLVNAVKLQVVRVSDLSLTFCVQPVIDILKSMRLSLKMLKLDFLTLSQ